MKRIFMFAMAVTSLLLSAALASAADTPKSSAGDGPAHPELVVSTQWLAEHLADPNLVIVHIGHDESDYRAAHIPGARYLAMNKIVTGDTPPGTELLPPEQLKKNLEEIGIGDESRVVYYAPDWDPMAARFFFTMDYLGHGNQTSLLDGGLDQWIREKRPASTEMGAGKPGVLTVHLHPEIVAKIDYMKKLVDGPASDAALVDARPSKRYRSGHLRSAGSFYWEKALVSEDEPLLKSPEQLRKLFAAAGVTGNKKAVSYCEVGLQASYVYLLARYLGIDVAMYDGSYNEWSAAKQPVIRGESPE